MRKLKFHWIQWQERNKKNIDEFMHEAFILLGFFLVCHGIYLIYKPAMWIFWGLGMLWIGMPNKK